MLHTGDGLWTLGGGTRRLVAVVLRGISGEGRGWVCIYFTEVIVRACSDNVKVHFYDLVTFSLHFGGGAAAGGSLASVSLAAVSLAAVSLASQDFIK